MSQRLWLALFFLASMAVAKDSKTRIALPSGGVKTPGVQIAMSALKPEATLELSAAPMAMHFGEAITVAEAGGLRRFDPKTNKSFTPSRDDSSVAQACGGVISAFGATWSVSCGKSQLMKLTEKDKKTSAVELGSAPVAHTALAATSDSVWLLADAKTTLLRIDPQTNTVVAEIRLPSACAALLSADNALWIACPNEARLLKLNPNTNLIDKRIEVAAEPVALASGAGAVWVLSRKEGKLSRIDPKTDKVVTTIDLGIPNAQGQLAFGAEALWASVVGFPLMRIEPGAEPEKALVAQQFYGSGGGVLAFGAGALWVGSKDANSLLRIDPRRVRATLPD
jgi:virginiamycin B lyase